MPGLPMPLPVKARRRSTRWPFQIARSKPGRCLIFMLVAISTLYVLHTSLYGTKELYWNELEEAPGVDNPKNEKPLSPLGSDADKTFRLGSTSKTRYKAELHHFVKHTFPRSLKGRARASIELYLGDAKALPIIPQKIYQIAKREPYWTDIRLQSWQNIPGYQYCFFDDARADKWVHATFGGTEIELVWFMLGAGIKRSDMLRYLLVMVEGGIYSDLDTTRLKPISKWGEGANFQGPELVNPPSVIVGIEADVGNREDWHKWWPRPLQIVQWTFAAAPMHPILIDTLRRIHRTTAKTKASTVKHQSSNQTEVRQMGGVMLPSNETVSVMEWTGPGAFTDSVIRYLAAKYGTTWPTLKDLRQPVRITDTVVLPITGFSPGVGLFGAGDTTDREAMVYHMFAGSWKKENPKGLREP